MHSTSRPTLCATPCSCVAVAGYVQETTRRRRRRPAGKTPTHVPQTEDSSRTRSRRCVDPGLPFRKIITEYQRESLSTRDGSLGGRLAVQYREVLLDPAKHLLPLLLPPAPLMYIQAGEKLRRSVANKPQKKTLYYKCRVSSKIATAVVVEEACILNGYGHVHTTSLSSRTCRFSSLRRCHWLINTIGVEDSICLLGRREPGTEKTLAL